MSKLALKVVAGASHTRIEGWVERRLRIRVHAKRERGKANQAVIECLANALGVSKSDLRITSGATATMKIVEVTDLSRTEITQRLA